VIDLLTAAGNAPFTVALLVMLGLLIFELISLFSGLGVNEVVDDLLAANVDFPDMPDDISGGYGDFSSGIEGSSAPEAGSLIGRVLAWLYVGRVPVLIVLVVFLGIFGLIGLFGQTVLRETIGLALPGLIAAPIAFFASLPLVRWTSAGLARILPRDETSAVSTRSFVGRTATVVGGNARTGLPAQARFRDQFGTTHYVQVEPEDADEVLESGSTVLLVRQINGRFSAIPNPNAALTDQDSGH
jgi:hypothetical protein